MFEDMVPADDTKAITQRPRSSSWAKRVKSWKAQGCDVFVFFDNDQKSAAPADALKLGQMLR